MTMTGDEILAYYMFLGLIIGIGCYACPKIKKVCHRICCEDSDDEEYEEEDVITPLASPASSTSSEGTYELALKPDYSSSEEPEDRHIRIKINDTPPPVDIVREI